MLKRLAIAIHLQHKKAYSWWKWREGRQAGGGPMSHIEREFYLKLRPALQGDNLVVYDIGASVGVVSGCLAKLPNVKAIHAFEPIPESFKALTERLRGYPRAKCHNVALSDENGFRAMCLSRSIDSSSMLPSSDLLRTEFPDVTSGDQIQVRAVRLDDYIIEFSLPKPNLIKIDVQGYEGRVLRGGEKTIKQANYCVLEMSLEPLYENSPLFDDVYRMMREMGFRLIGFAGDVKGKSGRQLQIDGVFVNEEAATSIER